MWGTYQPRLYPLLIDRCPATFAPRSMCTHAALNLKWHTLRNTSHDTRTRKQAHDTRHTRHTREGRCVPRDDGGDDKYEQAGEEHTAAPVPIAQRTPRERTEAHRERVGRQSEGHHLLCCLQVGDHLHRTHARTHAQEGDERQWQMMKMKMKVR